MYSHTSIWLFIISIRLRWNLKFQCSKASASSKVSSEAKTGGIIGKNYPFQPYTCFPMEKNIHWNNEWRIRRRTNHLSVDETNFMDVSPASVVLNYCLFRQFVLLPLCLPPHTTGIYRCTIHHGVYIFPLIPCIFSYQPTATLSHTRQPLIDNRPQCSLLILDGV